MNVRIMDVMSRTKGVKCTNIIIIEIEMIRKLSQIYERVMHVVSSTLLYTKRSLIQNAQYKFY